MSGLQVRTLPIVGLVNVLILIDIEISLLTSRELVNGTNSEIQKHNLPTGRSLMLWTANKD